jgi:hypothetical protein
MPAAAGQFSLYPVYWDTDAAGEALGGGVTFGIQLGDSPFDLDLRASVLQQGTVDDPFGNSMFFEKSDLQMAPVEVGLRFNFAPSGHINPWVGGGASYVFLDLDENRANVADETGWYASVGASFGDPDGWSLFVEGLYRGIEATVERDPRNLGDIDDIDLDERVAIDLTGPSVLLGGMYSF